jgi:ribose/xylose/arabinose/galactoside ABC-type transport system permease subunit
MRAEVARNDSTSTSTVRGVPVAAEERRAASKAHAPAVYLKHRPLLLAVGMLLSVLILFSILSPAFLSPGNLRNILLSSSILMIASSGAALIIIMGSIDLSVGAVATIAGLLTSLLAPRLGPLAILVGVPVGVAFGAINGLLHVYLRIPSILVTLGTATSISGLALFVSDGSSLPVWDKALVSIAMGEPLPFVTNLMLIGIALYAVMHHIDKNTRLGRAAFAIGGDEMTAELLGVRVRRYKILIFALCGLTAGIAGSLLSARLGTATVKMGDYLMLQTITAVVVGGTAITGGAGGVAQTLIGVLVITLLSNGMNIIALHPYIQTVVFGLVILLAVFIMRDTSRLVEVK